MILSFGHLLPCLLTPANPLLKLKPSSSKSSITSSLNSTNGYPNKPPPNSIWPNTNNLLHIIPSIAISVALITTPLPASSIPSLSSKPPLSFSPQAPTTPFSQARNMPKGLDNGKIRPCPSINPGCISTNPKSSNFAFPWSILDTSASENESIDRLKDAIMKTQKNVSIQVVKDMEDNGGKYLQAEVDAGFGARDLLEFLVKGDVVSYRAMATKVTYVYPFTTALGDSKGQEGRVNQIVQELGWYAPSFESMDVVE